MTFWSNWEEISGTMAVLCLTAALATVTAAFILLAKEKMLARLLQVLCSGAGRRTGALAMTAIIVWIFVLGQAAAAAETESSESGNPVMESESESGDPEPEEPGPGPESSESGNPETGPEAPLSDEKAPQIFIQMMEETGKDEEGNIYCRKDNAGIRVSIEDDSENDSGIVSFSVVITDQKEKEIRREYISGQAETGNTEAAGSEGDGDEPELSSGEPTEVIEIDSGEIAELADGTIRVAAEAADAAGNRREEEFRFILDTTPPAGELRIESAEGEVFCRLTAHESVWTADMGGFMPYRKEREAVIGIRAEDASPVSVSVRVLSTSGEENDAAPDAERFSAGCEERIRIRGGQVFRIENLVLQDRAGNVSAVLRRTVNFYLDTQPPEVDLDAPAAVIRAVPEITARSPDGRPLYNGAVTLAVYAEDPDKGQGGSGLREVWYSVKIDGETVEEDTLFWGGETPDTPIPDIDPESEETAESAEIAEIAETGSFADTAADDAPVYAYSGEITVPAGGQWESGGIEVTVTAVDNAGNYSSREGGSFVFEIDTKGPEVSVLYDNNDVRNGLYFDRPRTAVISVRERNFAKENLQVEAPGAQIGDWVYRGQNGSDEWTLAVRFTADGTYTLAVNGTDAPGNPASVRYSGEAAQAFTIDRTPPRIEVLWDNEDARNEKYYNRPRYACVRITDLSLDDRAVKIWPISRPFRKTAEARDGRTAGVIPVYEAELPFTEEGEWMLGCLCTDLAGNTSVPVLGEPFVIDMTSPRLAFEGEPGKEMGACGTEVSPRLRVEEENPAAGSAQILLYNRSCGSVTECRGGGSETTGVIALPDLPGERALDGVCTLLGTACDLAGNRTQIRRNLCVNRFGSLYDLSEDEKTMEILDQFYTDASSAFVVTEYNVSPLTGRQITLFRNGNARILTEDKDYSVTEKRSGEGVKYTYTIDPEVFSLEGKYSLLLESEDEAGNYSSSPGRFTAGAEYSPSWAVDRTPPEVRIVGTDEGKNKYVADSVLLRLVPSDNMEIAGMTIEVTDDRGNMIEKRTVEKEELSEILRENGGEVEYELEASGKWQTLKAKAVDGAGNCSAEAECRMLVTSNLMVHLYRSGVLPGIAFLAVILTIRHVYDVYKNTLA